VESEENSETFLEGDQLRLAHNTIRTKAAVDVYRTNCLGEENAAFNEAKGKKKKENKSPNPRL